MKFLFRRETGKIESYIGESANHALNQIGTPLSWDGDLNTVDVKLPSGRVEKIVLTGTVKKKNASRN